MISGIRQDFPILGRKIYGKPLVYLDNAATTQKPRQVINAISAYYSHSNSNVHRAIHKLSQEATAMYDSAHDKVAKFINAGPGEVVFTANATSALNIAANALSSRLGPGDEILLTQMEHHSNLVPWQQAALRSGAKIKYIPVEKDGTLGSFEIGRKTRIVAFTHCSNVLGTINPAKEIIRQAKDSGAVTVVDAAQSVPHMPVDVKKLGCDLLAFSGHKMLGPTGIGVLYGTSEILSGMEPLMFGGDMISRVSFDSAAWNELPWKFEAGTPNMAGAAGMIAAIDYLEKIGMDSVEGHEKALVKRAMKLLGGIDGLEIYGPARRSGLVSFNINGIHAHDVSALLDSEGIAVRGGHHCAMPLAGLLGIMGSARASFYIYNTLDEIDMLAGALEKIARSRLRK